MKILLIRFSSFGDVVFTLPLARALKSHRPGVEVAWAIEEPLAPLVEGAAFVDRVLPARTRVWRHSLLSRGTRGEIAVFLRSARSFAPDLVVDAQGLFKSAWATLLVPAARKVGYGPGTATERINCLTTREWVDARGRPHAIDRSLALAEHVAGRGGWDRIPDVSHLVAQPDAAVDAWLDGRGGRPFALLQPWSSRGAKEWGAESVLDVAGKLAERGLEPVVKWGPAEEGRAAALAAASGGRLVLAPRAGPAATGGEGALDQGAGTVADHRPHLGLGQRRAPVEGEQAVHRRGDVGQTVDQGAVEIK